MDDISGRKFSPVFSLAVVPPVLRASLAIPPVRRPSLSVVSLSRCSRRKTPTGKKMLGLLCTLAAAAQ